VRTERIASDGNLQVLRYRRVAVVEEVILLALQGPNSQRRARVMEYECTKCKTLSVKLWREYQIMYTDLFCVDCACNRKEYPIDPNLFDCNRKEYPIDPNLFDEDGTYPNSTRKIRDGQVIRTDQMPWLVPAVELLGKDGFYSLGSTPAQEYDRWKKLPLRLTPEEVVVLRIMQS
jgi:hypothetical protein